MGDGCPGFEDEGAIVGWKCSQLAECKANDEGKRQAVNSKGEDDPLTPSFEGTRPLKEEGDRRCVACR